ncbi:MAG: type II toxin-antitoxin system VapC family toxin [Deltaproteobacteria bacterium]|nr:type II toxin-antitoxin system VapC family toxin [Deltaproteobacteria bacterium]
MLAYLDSSVLLRIIFNESTALPEFKKIRHAISSELIKIECLRTIDRMRIRLSMPDEEVEKRIASVFYALDRIELIPVSEIILDRASQPFPTMLGTLDAIHLASALEWQSAYGSSPIVVTHDQELGRAARSMGFEVLGCSEDVQ